MARHIRAVAAEHGVAVSWMPASKKWWEAESFPTAEPPIALVPRPERGADYMIALHEIGHCASPDAVLVTEARGPYAHVLCEGGAWAFASAVADRRLLRHLKRRDWAHVATAIGSHIRAAAVSQEGDDGPVRH